MLVKIHKPKTAHGFVNTESTLNYNLSKVKAGTAEVIAFRGMENPSDCKRVIRRMENGSIRGAKETCFHMSLNPHPLHEEDNLDESQITELITGLLSELGYGNQPWIAFRHHDIDRVHYHIVSTRIGENGHKIPSFQDHRRARAALERLQPQFGYSLTSSEDEAQSVKDAVEKERTSLNLESFNQNRPESETLQIASLARNAFQYRFTTIEQYACLLHSMGVEVEYKDGMALYAGMTKGHRCTRAMTSQSIDAPSLAEIRSAAARNKSIKIDAKVKYRTARLSRFALPHSRNERHFIAMMKKMSIECYISRKDDGTPFGVTYIDHQNRCVWKASELGKEAVTAADLQAKYDLSEWTLPKKSRRNERLDSDLSPHSIGDEGKDIDMERLFKEAIAAGEDLLSSMLDGGYGGGHAEDEIDREYRKRMRKKGLSL